MRFDPYTRFNQILIDAAVVGICFFASYQLRYEFSVPAFYRYQFLLLFAPIVAGRLLMNAAFGVPRIQWRYITVRDAFRIGAAYCAFSAILLGLRFTVPDSWATLRIPVGVIGLEVLLSANCALGVRMLRRILHERASARLLNQRGPEKRRILLIGAGILGSNVAKEMASRPHIEIVGFLDDDAAKVGSTVAGARVLGPTTLLPEFVRARKVDDVLVCIAPNSRNADSRLWNMIENLSVRSRFVPTIDEVLDATAGVEVVRGKTSAIQTSMGQDSDARVHRRPEKSTIRGKVILITGGGGFIGTHVAQRLVEDNEVILLDRSFDRQPIGFTSLMKHPNVRLVEADIMEGEEMGRLAREAEIVVHAAALLGVSRVCTYPRETLETNFVGTSRLLQTVEKSARLQRFIYFSTSEVFGVNSFRVNENTPAAVGPAAEARWSYSIAKLAGEHLVKSYHRQTGLPGVTVRPFNIFGPRRVGSHAMSEFIVNALQNKPLFVHGDGSQIRSWCYVEDFCDALVEMMARPGAVGEDFNIGNPTNTLTIYQLANRVVELSGSSSPIVFKESDFPDIGIRVPSLEKARSILGYQPKYDLDRGLALTIDWYRQNLKFFEAKPAPVTAIRDGRAKPAVAGAD